MTQANPDRLDRIEAQLELMNCGNGKKNRGNGKKQPIAKLPPTLNKLH